MRIVFVGESLIDFTAAGALAFQGHVGGALANSAVAAARLGVPTGFVTQLSTDLFGERLLERFTCDGIDTRFVLRSDAPSTLAFVERTPTSNRYAFYMQGTA
ncbi:MAG: carbohydrate kinase, partial [Variovorax paradoxus]